VFGPAHAKKDPEIVAALLTELWRRDIEFPWSKPDAKQLESEVATQISDFSVSIYDEVAQNARQCRFYYRDTSF
jgi:hypothetical protein